MQCPCGLLELNSVWQTWHWITGVSDQQHLGKTPLLRVNAEICGERNMHSATDSSEGLRNIPKYYYSSTRVLTCRDSATTHTLNFKANLLNKILVQRQLETYLILLVRSCWHFLRSQIHKLILTVSNLQPSWPLLFVKSISQFTIA